MPQFLCLVLLSWPYPGSVKRGACTRKIPVFFPSLSPLTFPFHTIGQNLPSQSAD